MAPILHVTQSDASADAADSDIDRLGSHELLTCYISTSCVYKHYDDAYCQPRHSLPVGIPNPASEHIGSQSTVAGALWLFAPRAVVDKPTCNTLQHVATIARDRTRIRAAALQLDDCRALAVG